MSKEVGELIEAALKTYKKRIYTINRLNPKTEVERNPRSKPVRTPLGDFTTQRAACKAHEVSDETIARWIRERKEGFTYIKEDNDEEN